MLWPVMGGWVDDMRFEPVCSGVCVAVVVDAWHVAVGGGLDGWLVVALQPSCAGGEGLSTLWGWLPEQRG